MQHDPGRRHALASPISSRVNGTYSAKVGMHTHAAQKLVALAVPQLDALPAAPADDAHAQIQKETAS